MFTSDRLARLAEIERWHFWFRGRQKLVEALLAQYCRASTMMLDVGCGTGYTLERLLAKGYTVVGIDGRVEGLIAAKHAHAHQALIQAEIERLPLMPASFQGAILLDVIEHVDDHTALNELARVLMTGSIVIMTTPAIPWLWSYRDVAAGHQRRYTASALQSVITHANFTTLEIRYYQFLLFPLVLISRILGHRGKTTRDIEDLPPQWINRILTAINCFEVSLSRWVRFPWGSSLVVVCQKH